MSGILILESLTRGNTLKQGDKTPLKYRLFDADGEKLNIAGKSAKVRLVYPDFLTIGYEKDGLTVAQDDTVTFTIDSVIPSRIYHVEIIVDDQFIFPSRADESKFTVDKSSLGTETNIIEIVGKDVLIREVKSQVDIELQPLVTSLESAQQAEAQRVIAEQERVQSYQEVQQLIEDGVEIEDGSLTNPKYADGSVSLDKADLDFKRLIKKDFTPITTTFQTGYFFYNTTSNAVTINTATNFQYSAPIHLPKGRAILLNCKGYNKVLATIVSSDENGENLKPLVVSSTSDLTSYQYTATEDMYVRISGQVSGFNLLGTFDDSENLYYKEKIDALSDEKTGDLKPTYTEHVGEYVTPTGTLNVQSLYTTTDIIELKIGEKLTFTALGSTASGVVSMLSKWSEDGTTFVANLHTTKGVVETVEYVATEDVEYLRISYMKGHATSVPLSASITDVTDEEAGIVTPTYAEYNRIYVTPKGGLNPQNSYSTSDIIELQIGEKIIITALGSTASGVVSLLSKWTEDGLTFLENLHTATGEVETIEYVATEDIEYLRISHMGNYASSPPLSAHISQIDYLDFKNILVKTLGQKDKEFLRCLVNNVTTVGDSLTAGGYYGFGYNGDEIKEDYPYMLAKLSGWNVTNSSSNGATASTWITRHADTTDFASSDLVIIGLGTNGALTDTVEEDTADGVFAETETGQYCWTVNEFRTQNPDVHIFLGLIAGPSHTEMTNSVIKKIAQKYDCKLLDDSELRGGAIMHPFGNSLHYGKVGNLHKAKIYYDQILNHISNNLADYEILLDEH